MDKILFQIGIHVDIDIVIFSLYVDCEQSPGVYLREEVQNYSELRVPSADKAAYYLDSALSGRSAHAHFLFTLHIYQYNVASKGAGTSFILFSLSVIWFK